jgi:hypothetical protein
MTERTLTKKRATGIEPAIAATYRADKPCYPRRDNGIECHCPARRPTKSFLGTWRCLTGGHLRNKVPDHSINYFFRETGSSMKDPLKLACIAGLMLLSLVLAGCGSSDDDTAEGGTATISKVAFIKQGDQICRDNYSKRTQLLTGYIERFKGKELPPISQQEEIVVNRVMPIFWEQSEELNSLPLPSKGTAEAEKFLAALEDSIESVEANPTKSIEQGTGVEFREAEQLGEDFGFQWCGRS